MPDVHALLSASSSKQWLHCPPSVRLQENFPNESSVYAAEGTYAHEVCEYKVRKYLKERVKRPQSEEYDTEEIEQITDVYAEFVITIIEEMKENGCEPLAFVEERVDYSHIAPSGFGTAVVPYMDMLQKLDISVLKISSPPYRRDFFMVQDDSVFLPPAAQRFRSFVLGRAWKNED